MIYKLNISTKNSNASQECHTNLGELDICRLDKCEKFTNTSNHASKMYIQA